MQLTAETMLGTTMFAFAFMASRAPRHDRQQEGAAPEADEASPARLAVYQSSHRPGRPRFIGPAPKPAGLFARMMRRIRRWLG